MLEVIGMSAVRMVKRRNRNPNPLNKKFNFAEAINAAGNRKVEKTSEAPVAKTEIEQKQGAYRVSDGIVYELYDKHGKISLQVPQKLEPIDEIA